MRSVSETKIVFLSESPPSRPSLKLRSSSSLDIKSLEATILRNTLLENQHSLLIKTWISRVGFELPIQELIRVIWLKTLVEDAETLSILSHLLPVTFDVLLARVSNMLPKECPESRLGELAPGVEVSWTYLQVLGEVRKGSLEDLAVDCRCHFRLHVNVHPVCFGWGAEDIVSCTLDRGHETSNLVGILGKEGIVGCCQNG